MRASIARTSTPSTGRSSMNSATRGHRQSAAAASILDAMTQQRITHPRPRRHRQDRPPRRRAPRARAACPVRVGSRSGAPRFDWEDRSTWAPALDGVARRLRQPTTPTSRSPGAVEAVGAFAELAVRSGVRRLVLLSGRGEPEAERAERGRARHRRRADDPARDAGSCRTSARTTCSTTSSAARSACPAGDVPTPFLDVDDIADVAVAALTDDRHVGRALRADRPALADVRRGGRARSPRRPAARSATCRSRSSSTRPSCAAHGVPAEVVDAARPTCSPRSSTAATRPRPTASRARSAASRATSPYARDAPRPAPGRARPMSGPLVALHRRPPRSAAAWSAACSSPSRRS